MFQGMTAFLEAIDERVGQHADDQMAMKELMTVGVKTKALEEEETDFARVHEVKFNHHNMEGECSHTEMSDTHRHVCTIMPNVEKTDVLLPKFPVQPPVLREKQTDERTDSAVGPQREMWNGCHIAEGVTAALTMGRDVESSLVWRQRDEEMDALKQDVRRQQVIAETARQELLQRSLKVHQLEEELRYTKSRLDDHKAKSRRLLEEQQRQCDALRRRLEVQNENHLHNDGSGSNGNAENVAIRERLEELECVAASMKQQNGQLQTQLAACRREVSVAQEEKHALVQQLEFVRLDLRGTQEALDSEVVAHRQSKAFLHRRQQELNELRAAVEKNGGIFSTTGALLSLRCGDVELRDQLLMSRQLLEKQNALEAALRDAAEWRRRCEQTMHRLEEERTTRVNVAASLSSSHRAEFRPFLSKRVTSSNGVISLVMEIAATVDAAALCIGQLLRRLPVLRIAATMYIFCLHVWLLATIIMISTVAVK